MLNGLVKAMKQASGGGSSARLRRQSRRMNRAVNAMEDSGVLSQGQLARLKDAAKAGMLNCGPLGLPICQVDGHVLFDNTDRPVSISGPPGSQKTTTIGMPMAAEWKGSAVFIDVDCEYARGVAAFRESLGHRSIFLNSASLYGLQSAFYNPFDPIIFALMRGDVHGAIELARDLAFILVPDTPEKKGNSNEWIDMAAREIVAMALVYLAKDHPERCTPGGVYEFLMRAVQQILDEIGAHASEEYPLRRAIKLQAELNAEAFKQLEWKFEKACEPLTIFESGSPYDMVTRQSSFDPAQAKDGERPLDIYLMIDGTKLESGGAFVSLMLSSIIERIAGASGNRHTLILADEFSQIPKSRILIKCLRAYRKRKIRTVTMTQSRQATIDRYGLTLARDIEAMAGTNIWLSPPYDVAKELSDKSGVKTVLTRSMNDRPEHPANTNSNISETNAPNLHVAQLVFDGGEMENKAIIESRSLPGLLVTEKAAWYEIYPYAEQLSNAYLDDSNRHAPVVSEADARALFGFDDDRFTRPDIEVRARLLHGSFPADLIMQARRVLEQSL